MVLMHSIYFILSKDWFDKVNRASRSKMQVANRDVVARLRIELIVMVMEGLIPCSLVDEGIAGNKVYAFGDRD